MSDLKIIVHVDNHIAVQLALFKCGYQWTSSGTRIIKLGARFAKTPTAYFTLNSIRKTFTHGSRPRKTLQLHNSEHTLDLSHTKVIE